ncbi:cofactor-independent phosphoglycerate mutase [Posidoniimonas polymericola]|uniref:Cofactor-independent phosphoglycerate mutase n=1 Tax=Posidoniimonas polymericola TaxID=2528002 RepID=A0A5C5YI77_9BACT|nr:cofactor-independent phosphoglycerate mutase [Posidoniimonas polymericola]TWT74568.1 cofactor-independent phosphoglycerate mutase [Posidoniimonas polymericola]
MKYLIIIPDGAADQPQESLGGKTPLEAAATPHMDAVVAQGVIASACHTPDELPAGSEIGNLSLLGYDPFAHFTGRAPMEAAAQRIALGKGDWAVRCNLVTIGEVDGERVMQDFTADHISTEESTALFESVQAEIASDPKWKGALEFVPGVSYRNLLIWRGAKLAAPFDKSTRTEAPHDWTDLPVANAHPRGPGADVLVELMDACADLLADHPVNKTRIANGKSPATNTWLWGQGGAPSLEPFAQKFGPKGAMITAVDLLRGIAALVGWDRIEVDGATGYLDTDYAAKGRAAIQALNKYDIVCVHIEAPDEASHEGRCDEKVKAIEQIDQHIVGPLLEALTSHGDWRVMISPDHPTFLSTKKHTHGNVPVAMAGAGVTPDACQAYGDTNAAASELTFDKGWDAMRWFIGE